MFFFCHVKAYLITLYNNPFHLASLMKIIKLYYVKQSEKINDENLNIMISIIHYVY